LYDVMQLVRLATTLRAAFCFPLELV